MRTSAASAPPFEDPCGAEGLGEARGSGAPTAPFRSSAGCGKSTRIACRRPRTPSLRQAFSICLSIVLGALPVSSAISLDWRPCATNARHLCSAAVRLGLGSVSAAVSVIFRRAPAVSPRRATDTAASTSSTYRPPTSPSGRRRSRRCSVVSTIAVSHNPAWRWLCANLAFPVQI